MNLKQKQEWTNWWMPRLGAAAMLIAIVVHAVWAARSGCPTDFQRGGAAVVVIALLVFAPIQYYADIDAGVPYLSGKRMTALSLFHPFFSPPIIAIIGTTLWGYGDIWAGWFMSGRCI